MAHRIRLDALLEKIVHTAPKALRVVARLTPISYKPAPFATYNSKIPGVIEARAGKGQHWVAVDTSKMPVSELGSDGLHPSDTGYAYMADVWYKAITGVLPK